MNKFIQLAASINGDGGSSELSSTEIGKALKDDQLAWLHLDASQDTSKLWIEKELTYLDHFIVDALTQDETRPRLLVVGDGLLLNLRGVNLNSNSDPEDMVSIRIWADKHRVISLSKQPLKTVAEIEKKLSLGKGPKNSGDLICSIATGLFNRMEPFMISLDDKIDLVDELVLEDVDVSLREKIVSIRKEVIMFRRYMAPQKDAIWQLKNVELPWLTDLHQRYFIELHNQITRYVEELDAIKERAQVIKDEIGNALSDKLNKNMYLLSIVAAIFLPLGFLTGLLGINVGGVPGSDNNLAFFIFCIFLFCVVLFQWFYFKRSKWI